MVCTGVCGLRVSCSCQVFASPSISIHPLLKQHRKYLNDGVSLFYKEISFVTGEGNWMSQDLTAFEQAACS